MKGGKISFNKALESLQKTHNNIQRSNRLSSSNVNWILDKAAGKKV